MVEIKGYNAPQAYIEALWKMHIYGGSDDSRNGRVITIPSPVMLSIKNPLQRVLTDPIRDANPFFHVMEFVWMMAGSEDAVWLSKFNKGMMNYAEDGILRGAYGRRWSHPTPQILNTISLLRATPTTRQAVIGIWDPVLDGNHTFSADRPCNTTIYFKIVNDRLDMLVCNRSNDLIWGMMGANVVHMTLLQELIAFSVGCEVGVYRVITNNLHVYPAMPHFKDIFATRVVHDTYKDTYPFPLLQGTEDFVEFMTDCKVLVSEDFYSKMDFVTVWMRAIAHPMYMAYIHKNLRDSYIEKIKATDWRKACEEWAARRNNKARIPGNSVSR